MDKSKLCVAMAIGTALLGAGAVGWEQGKVVAHDLRRQFLLRILAEELEKAPEISQLQGEKLKQKALQLQTENRDLIDRMVEIMIVADGGQSMQAR